MKTRSKKNLKEIEREIGWYGVPAKSSLAKAMLALGKLGFEFCGHGIGYGIEEFELDYKLGTDSYIGVILARPREYCQIILSSKEVYKNYKPRSYTKAMARARQLLKEFKK